MESQALLSLQDISDEVVTNLILPYLTQKDQSRCLTCSHHMRELSRKGWASKDICLPAMSIKLLETFLNYAEDISSIDLSNNTYVTDDHIKLLDKRYLRKLNVNGCKRITLSSLQDMDLTHLELKRLPIRDEHLAYLETMPLQHLNLDSCRFVTDVGLSYLSKMHLQHLNLRNLFNITDRGLFHLPATLQHLNLDSCFKIGDGGLTHLERMNLQHLDLRDTNITDNGLTHLKHMQLQHLNLHDTEVTPSGVSNLIDFGIDSRNIHFYV